MIPPGFWRGYVVPLACFFACVIQAGCGSRSGETIVVATAWPADRCARIERELGDWLKSSTKGEPQRPFGVSWVWLAEGDDLGLFARRRSGIDVLLGGPIEAYKSLAAAGVVKRSDESGKSFLVSLDVDPSSSAGHSPVQPARLDDKFLSEAERELAKGEWPAGYERLIRMTDPGTPRPEEPSTSASLPEGAAMIVWSRRTERAAKLFLTFLEEKEGAKPLVSRPNGPGDSSGLLAVLLEATLIEARPELLDAWSALKSHPDAAPSLRWMCEAPPWPPASIEKILATKGDQAMSLLETLAAQISPDPLARDWLLRSWLLPRRSIDADRLQSLASAVDGALAREPRFRWWLRAEWRAWARQRYRRVARQARAGHPVLDRESWPLPDPAPSTSGEGRLKEGATS